MLAREEAEGLYFANRFRVIYYPFKVMYCLKAVIYYRPIYCVY